MLHMSLCYECWALVVFSASARTVTECWESVLKVMGENWESVGRVLEECHGSVTGELLQ
jgi:hypothetical protein